MKYERRKLPINYEVQPEVRAILDKYINNTPVRGGHILSRILEAFDALPSALIARLLSDLPQERAEAQEKLSQIF